MAKKEEAGYWQIIRIPVLALIGWSVIGLIISLFSFDFYMSIFGGLASIILAVAAYSFLGVTSVRDFKTTVGRAAKLGILAGAIVGFAGGVIGIIMIFTTPQLLEYTIQQGINAGATRTQVEGLAKIGMYTGVLSGPIMHAIIGVVCASIAGAIVSIKKKK